MIQKLLANYQSENPGVLKNLHQLLSFGVMGNTGKLLLYAVDQGFELGPASSFLENPDALDPDYHFKFAIEAKLSGIAAPYGLLNASVSKFIGQIPLILKINSNNHLINKQEVPPYQSITGSVDQALKLGCCGIGFTIYPGSNASYEMYSEIQEIAEEAKNKGLVVIIWAYPRGNMSKTGETATDTVAYSTHIACLLGAHIVKVKIPNETYEIQKEHYKNLTLHTTADRINHVMDCAFSHKRMVLFSGGEQKSKDEFLDEIKAIHKGKGSGSIIGRNLFQRPYKEALSLAENIVKIYKTNS